MFEKEIAEAKARGNIMPNTAMRGYIYQWEDNADLTDEQNERAHEWMCAEINRRLPDYATWYESTSEIVLPIDKANDFDIDWNNLLEKAYDSFLENEESIIDGQV